MIAIIGVIGISYAIWQLTLTQTGTNVVATGCFNIEFTEKNPIHLGNNVYPITDEEGASLTPYEFTITNTCDSEATYYINLETLSNSEKNLNEKYIKASLMDGEKEIFLNTLEDTYINTEKVISEASRAFKLAKGNLRAKESKTYSLRLWLDYDTPAIESVMNATYEGKITINFSYVPAADENKMMIARDYNNDIYYSTFADSHKIIFVKEDGSVGDIEPMDISKNQTGGVLAYVDRTNPDNIVTYIKANGIILFPEDSGGLFLDFVNLTSIEGLENVNTYYVSNMESMFNGCISLTSLDLSNFDTSNVTDMSYMFSIMSSLTSLDISNFDTSKLTNMEEMFSYCNSLTSLDLSHFDTSNVKSMVSMFRESSFETLNLSGWDVSKLDDSMGGGSAAFENLSSLTNLNISNWKVSSETIQPLFLVEESCPVLTYINASNWHWKKMGSDYDIFGFNFSPSIETLDISNWRFEDNSPETEKIVIPSGFVENLIAQNWVFPENADLSGMFQEREYNKVDLSGWDTSNVTNMQEMFVLAHIENLDISSFDTRNVTNMTGMFRDMSGLTSLDVSSFDTSNVSYMTAMFAGMSNLTTLDISNFDTKSVTDMVGMFQNDSSLTNITYGDKFIYRSDIVISNMFDGCPANKPTHSSWTGVLGDEEGGTA